MSTLTNYEVSLLYYYHHPLINPIVNPADILRVNGIPKLVIANEEAVAAASDNDNNNNQRIIMTTILAGVISGIAIATIIVIKRK